MNYGIKDFFVLLFYRSLSGFPIPKRTVRLHREKNREAWEKHDHEVMRNGYIEFQDKLSFIQYGKRYFADYNACEVIAAYNAMVYLRRAEDFPMLLSLFERRGITAGGAFGTSPFALRRFFREKGYRVKSYTYTAWKRLCRGKKDQEFAEQAGAVIIVMYNDNHSIWGMIHTMCLTKENNGFRLHNDYEGCRWYPDIQSAAEGYRNGRGRLLWIMGISGR